MADPEMPAAQPDIPMLAIAEQRYRALVRATSSLVWTTSPDGQIVDMPEWRAYTGITVAQIKGWGWLDSLHPDDRERTAAVWQQAVDSRSFYETEYRIRRRDGAYVWHQARGVPILDANGSIREWVGLCLDIDLRKRAEEKRVEAEKALRDLNEILEHRVELEARERARIWNVSQEMLAVADLEGKFLTINPAWSTILGWSETEVIGHTFQWFVHPEDRHKSNAELAHLTRGSRTRRFENRLRHKDGSFRRLSWTAIPDRGHIYAIARDVTAIKAAEEELQERTAALRRSESYLAEAQRLSHTGTWAFNSTTTLYWSEENFRIWGLDPLLGLPTRETVRRRIHPDDRDRVHEGAEEALRQKRDYAVEFRILLPDGTVKYLEAIGRHLFSASGELLEVVGTHVDVTERKRAEERLRVQHTVGEILAEAATIEEVTPRILRATGECLGWDVGALWRVDREAEVLRCVELWHKASIEVSEFERVSRDFAFAPGLGLPGRVWSSLEPEYIPDVVPDPNFPRAPIAQREGLHEAFGFPILLGGEVLGVIEFFSRKIGQPDQELLNVLANIGSQIGQFIERKRAEAELRESEQNYRMLFESIDEGFCTIEVLFDENERPVDYRFLQISPSFERQTGIKNAGGRRMREIAPQHEEHWFEIYGKIALTGEPMRFENEAKQLGRWYDVYAFRVEDPNRKHVGILFNDITERKRVEAEARESERRYREALMELAHANRVTGMGQLTASIAHEITQPIGAVVNNARAALNWLGAQPPDLEEVRQALGEIVNDGMRADDVINRIRALIKKAPPRQEEMEINEAVLEVIALTHSEVVKNGVSVRTQLAEDLPHVHGDRVQLQQVLLNLIINAIEAMRGISERERELLITTRDEPDGVLVEVRDSGPGFAPAAFEHVFEAFYTTKPGGLGLGLSICRSIIEAHNGRLWASPNLPRGAVFRFIAPAHGDSE